MKKLTQICALAFLILVGSSCKNEKSLQSYLVETSGKQGFQTGDFPVSSLLSAKADVSDEIKETIKTIKKINFVFLPKTDDNTVTYETEKAKLKNIFSNNADYKSLGAMKFQGMNAKLFFSGDTGAIDEVVLFGYGDKNGVGVARLLGDDINPAKILEMMNNIKMKGNSKFMQNLMKDFNAI